MADERITRRGLLLGRIAGKPTPLPAAPITKEGRPLPDVISWLAPNIAPFSPRAERARPDAPFPILRPPGAIAEPEFLAACTRCGDCITACQPSAIRSAPPLLRAAADTPIIQPLEAPCALCEDLPCISACESGALRPEAPATLGTAHIQLHDCLNRLGSECSVCLERCPVPGALSSVAGAPEVNAALCTGCGMCQYVCPAPRNAVTILPNPDRPTRTLLEARAASKVSKASETDDAAIELPELREEIVDDDTLRSLFADLSSLTRVLEVKLKGGPTRYASASAVSLPKAEALLFGGSVHAVQIVYEYRSETWCDTLMRTPKGTRILRMKSPARATGHS